MGKVSYLYVYNILEHPSKMNTRSEILNYLEIYKINIQLVIACTINNRT